ncbi:MAG: hypothetical protein ABIR15_15135 [Chitinophagaceae bacterium]
MRKKIIPCLAIAVVFFAGISCQKNIDDFVTTGNMNAAHTVANISGTYSLKSLTWTYMSTTISVYDSLDACEKDDLYKFNTNMTLDLIDAGIVCSPPGTDTEPWLLRNDSIFLGTSTGGAKIKSFDGITLVLSGTPVSDPGVNAVTTFVKK